MTRLHGGCSKSRGSLLYLDRHLFVSNSTNRCVEARPCDYRFSFGSQVALKRGLVTCLNKARATVVGDIFRILHCR